MTEKAAPYYVALNMQSKNDADFDRYTAMARRSFDATLAIISTIDGGEDGLLRQRSVAGSVTSRSEKMSPHAISPFCKFILLPEGPEFLVVEDTHLDHRFGKYSAVNGQPPIRFYAGRALIIENVKIGALCVMDMKPRETFSEEDRYLLTSLAEVVVDIIRRRHEARLQAIQMKTEMILQLMHNLRTPLSTMEMSIAMMSPNNDAEDMEGDGDHGGKNSKKELQRAPITFRKNETSSTRLFAERELRTAIGHLDFLVESSMTLAEIILEQTNTTTDSTITTNTTRNKEDGNRPITDRTSMPAVIEGEGDEEVEVEGNEERRKRKKQTEEDQAREDAATVNVLEAIFEAREKIAGFYGTTFLLHWLVDLEQHLVQGVQKCSAKVVYFIILQCIEQLSEKWYQTCVTVQFVPYDDNKANIHSRSDAGDTPCSSTATGTTSMPSQLEEEVASKAAASKNEKDDNRRSTGEGDGGRNSDTHPERLVTADDAGPTGDLDDSSNEWVDGVIRMNFRATAPRRDREGSKNQFAHEAHLDFYSLQNILSDYYGGMQESSDRSSETIECWVPCCVASLGFRSSAQESLSSTGFSSPSFLTNKYQPKTRKGHAAVSLSRFATSSNFDGSRSPLSLGDRMSSAAQVLDLVPLRPQLSSGGLDIGIGEGEVGGDRDGRRKKSQKSPVTDGAAVPSVEEGDHIVNIAEKMGAMTVTGAARVLSQVANLEAAKSWAKELRGESKDTNSSGGDGGNVTTVTQQAPTTTVSTRTGGTLPVLRSGSERAGGVATKTSAIARMKVSPQLLASVSSPPSTSTSTRIVEPAAATRKLSMSSATAAAGTASGPVPPASTEAPASRSATQQSDREFLVQVKSSYQGNDLGKRPESPSSSSTSSRRSRGARGILEFLIGGGGGGGGGGCIPADPDRDVIVPSSKNSYSAEDHKAPVSPRPSNLSPRAINRMIQSHAAGASGASAASASSATSSLSSKNIVSLQDFLLMEESQTHTAISNANISEAAAPSPRTLLLAAAMNNPTH